MKTLPRIFFILFLGSYLFSCAGPSAGIHQDTPRYEAPESALTPWIEEVLIPYLTEQLSRHPRFNGQPFLLVGMEGDNIQTDINDLTAQIRERIADALLAQPGIQLSWRPAVRPWRHHQSLEELSCADYRRIQFYIGIDAGLTKVDRSLYVKVRALDLKEETWVSGFGLSWSGRPGINQLNALHHRQADEYLRGLRPLPFNGGEPDLLASYLAQNLSCLFRQQEMDEIIVYMNRKELAGAPKGALNWGGCFNTTLDLVGNYLSRFREVRVTEDPQHATVVIDPEIHAIHDNLYQIWVSARVKGGETALSGIETETYLLLDDDKIGETAGPPSLHGERPHPLDGPTPERLISDFTLVTPENQALCGTETPWILGEKALEEGGRLPSNSCLAAQIRLTRRARIFLIGQDGEGRLLRLFPSECRTFQPMDNLQEAEREFRFPPVIGSDVRALWLDNTPGTERIYAVAVTDPIVSRKLARRVGRFQGLCREGEAYMSHVSHDPVARWQRYLNHMAENSGGHLEWQVREFQHDRGEMQVPL